MLVSRRQAGRAPSLLCRNTALISSRRIRNWNSNSGRKRKEEQRKSPGVRNSWIQPSVSGLILHEFFREGHVRDLDIHRHTHARRNTHRHTHRHTHTESQAKPCITGCHCFPKKLTRACPDFNKDLLTVLHFSPVFEAILIF